MENPDVADQEQRTTMRRGSAWNITSFVFFPVVPDLYAACWFISLRERRASLLVLLEKSRKTLFCI